MTTEEAATAALAGGGGGWTAAPHQPLGRRRSRFTLEELLCASVEMVGLDSLSTVYRAILRDGHMAVVKRLRDACWE